MHRIRLGSVHSSLRATLAAVALAAPATAKEPVQVKVEARFVEVTRDAARDLGISWATSPGALRADAIPSGPLPDTGATVLASPAVTTPSAGTATVEAGGPIPATGGVPSPGDFELRLHLTPTVGSGGAISLRIDAETPQLDAGVSPPSVTMRTSSTTVLVPEGGSVAIGGLLQPDASRLGQSVPGLAKLPVLGRLFSSRSHQDEQSRLLVLVTPTLVDSEGGGSAGGAPPSASDRDDGDSPPVVYGGFDYFGVQPSEAARPDFPLVTSKRLVLVDNPATGRPFQGELTGPDTRILYDASETGYPFASGFKGEVGGWFGRESRFGLELNGFYVPETTTSTELRSGEQDAFFSVPFFNNAIGSEYSVVVGSDLAGSPTSRGIVDVGSSIDLWGVGGALRMRDLVDCDDVDLGFSAGFRYVRLSERFWIDYDTAPSVNTAFGQGTLGSFLFAGGPTPVAGSRIHAQDDVTAENDFYGLDLGLDATMEMLPGLSFRIAPRVALGAAVQEVDVFGSGRAWQPDGSMRSTPYGVFARPGYVGVENETNFAVVPEIDLEFRYRIVPGLELSAGYNFFYLSDVVQAGDQLSRSIDAPIDAVGAFRAPPRAGSRRGFETGDFYANSVRLGLRFQF